MTEDPIVAEVRAVREELFKECGYSLEKLVEYFQSQRKRMGLKVVRLHPRQVRTAKSGSAKESQKRLVQGNTSHSQARPTPPAHPRKRKVI